MTTFKSSISDRTATIDGLGYPELCIRNNNGEVLASIALSEKDAPAIAFAALGAGGIEPLFYTSVASNELTAAQLAEQGAYYLQRSARKAAKEAAAAAEEAARNKRRDELACEIGNEFYHLLGHTSRKLVDRIIDLEQELAKERAKQA